MGKLRALRRGVLFLMMAVVALTEFFFWRDKSLRGRALWMQRWSRYTLSAMGVSVRVVGEPPHDGLLVSNHMGYLDVLAIGSIAPFVFVSKSEVKHWPVAGALTRAAGTIFVDRGNRAATAAVTAQMKERMEAGLPVVLFPEGTSSDGSGLLPFHSSLFAAPIEAGASIHMAALRYAVPGDADGARTVQERVAYWGDMSFGAHVLSLLALKRVEAEVEFFPATVEAGERKSAAVEAERIVRQMLSGRD